MLTESKIRCLVLDDEPLAADLIVDYCERLTHLQVLEVFHNALDAFSYLQHQSIDLLFLDIHLPKLNGLDFFKSLQVRPQVIFTTAYREYAVEGFELEAVDYLVKPIRFDRFLKAVARLNTTISLQENKQEALASRPYLFFREGREMIKVFLDEILWIESMKNYVKINLGYRVIITYRRISHLEESLPHNLFLRIHKSFIIAIAKVTNYGQNQISIQDTTLPIGRSYKRAVLERLK